MSRSTVVIELSAAPELAAGGVFVPACTLRLAEECDLVVRGATRQLRITARVVYVDPRGGAGLELLGFSPEMKAQLAELAAATPTGAPLDDDDLEIWLANDKTDPGWNAGPAAEGEPANDDAKEGDLEPPPSAGAIDARRDLEQCGAASGDGTPAAVDELDLVFIEPCAAPPARTGTEPEPTRERAFALARPAARITATRPVQHAAELDAELDFAGAMAAELRAELGDDEGGRAGATGAAHSHGDQADDPDGDDAAYALTEGERAPGELSDPTNDPDVDEADDPDEGASASGRRPATSRRRFARNVHERLRGLTLAAQIKVAAQGELHERIMLERLYGKNVWETLLRNSRLTAPEVSRIARYGSLPRVLLEIIVGNNAWLQVPEVRRALLANPRLAADQVVKVLRLTPKHELKLAAVQTAYPPAVRNAAKLLLRSDS